MSFESLEDNFMKKANEPIKTDVQHNADVQKNNVVSDNDKETYEDSLEKNKVIGGLAALFQEKLKSKKDEDNDQEDKDTVFITTKNVRYGDRFQDATNYVDEKDIQKFLPGDVYNDSITEPELENGEVEFDQRHSVNNKYNDNLSFEPSIASESDISPRASISNSIQADAPYSDQEISDKLAQHNEKKNKKQFSENTWSPNNTYDVGPKIDTQSALNKNENENYSETELTEEEYRSTTNTTDTSE